MDEKLLRELLVEAERHGGGLLLNLGDKPEAVVLSVDAYSQLLAGKLSDLLPSVRETEQEQAPQRKQTMLVTGGAGYIGGHVVREALANNFSVVVLDNLVTGRREHVPDEAVFVEGDVRDVNLLRDIFTQYSVDAVVHLAALLEVQESVDKPMEYFEVNVIGTARLLSAMHEAGVGSLVFSSTAAVYGTQETVPIQEDATCIPTNPYGWSKFLAEQHIRYFAEHGGVTATVLRFFNVAGSKEGWGVRDTHARAHLVPVVLDVAAGAQSSLRLFGQDWPTLDGTCVRDYVHVYDIARAHIFALRPSTGARFRVYNVGTGRGSSVSEIVQAAAEVTGRMVPMEVAPRRPGDDAQLVAHVGKIARELGFTAMHSSLEEIIRSAWLARSL